MKIALIDDKSDRQEKALSKFKFKLNDYCDILENITNTKYNDFSRDFDIKKLNYDIIICHKSAFSESSDRSVIELLKIYCKQNNKRLVLFSGGTTNTSYIKTPFECLELNAKTFYSLNLKLFLDNCRLDKCNILELAYGAQAEFLHVLAILENIKVYISNCKENEEIDYDDFETDTSVDRLNDYFNKPKNTNKTFTKKELENIYKEILSKLKIKAVMI